MPNYLQFFSACLFLLFVALLVFFYHTMNDTSVRKRPRVFCIKTIGCKNGDGVASVHNEISVRLDFFGRKRRCPYTKILWWRVVYDALPCAALTFSGVLKSDRRHYYLLQLENNTGSLFYTSGKPGVKAEAHRDFFLHQRGKGNGIKLTSRSCRVTRQRRKSGFETEVNIGESGEESYP